MHGVIAMWPKDPKLIHNIWGTPEGESPADYHVTLMYLGSGDDLADLPFVQIENLLYNLSLTMGQAVGRLGGFGVFPPQNGTYPVWLPVDSIPITHAHNAVMNQFEDLNRSTHGFIPHLTIAYTKNPERYMTPLLTAPVNFGRIGYKIGPDVVSFEIKP